MIDLDKLQKDIYQNKLDKGFDASDSRENMYRQFCHIHGEVAEAFDAYYKGLDNFNEELADICIYILGLCEIKGISLEQEILKKLNKNKERTYEKVNGVLVKSKGVK